MPVRRPLVRCSRLRRSGCAALGLCAALALAGCGAGRTAESTPIFAGGEPVNPQLQQLYASAPLLPDRPGTDWAQFGGDPRHAFDGHARRPLRGRIAWFVRFGDPVLSAPAAVANTVFVGGTDGFLRALDAETGAERWRAGLGDSLDDASPAVGDGRVYVNGFGTRILAFDARSGRLLWQADTGRALQAPPTYVRGLVLVPSDGNYLSCFDARTGRLYWRFQSEDALADFWPTLGAAASDGTDAFVALGASSEFMAIDLRSGRKRWEYALGERPAGAPVLSGGDLYLAGASGRLLRLGAADGAVRWQVTLPQGHPAGTHATPLVIGGRVLIGGCDGVLYAFSSTTGRLLWLYRDSGPLLATPVGIASRIYLPGASGALTAIDAASGHRLWSLALGEMRGSAAVHGGLLYVTSIGARGIYAIR